jgi:hypothetical protein
MICKHEAGREGEEEEEGGYSCFCGFWQTLARAPWFAACVEERMNRVDVEGMFMVGMLVMERRASRRELT